MGFAIDSSSSRRFETSNLNEQIEALWSRLHPSVSMERRYDDRVSVPILFRLTPLDADRKPLEDEAITVVGKDMSRRGMSFYHERPLPYRRAVIRMEHGDSGQFAAEIDINWCRFTRPGWYESGGRLVRAIVSEPLTMNGRPELRGFLAEMPTSGRGAW